MKERNSRYSQCVAIKDLGGHRARAKTNGLSRTTKGCKPNHEFELGLGRVLSGRLIAINKHIDGHVGVETVGSKIRKGGGRCGLIADAVGPFEIDIDFGNAVNGGGQYVGINLDVGESVYGVVHWANGILP